MTRILVTGSRDWTDSDAIRLALLAAFKDLCGPFGEPPTVVHGACPTGADSYADTIAHGFGWFVEAHPADWEHLGKAAGPIRNQQMVDLGADVCLAFILPQSKGTLDCILRAERAGILVRRHWREQEADQ